LKITTFKSVVQTNFVKLVPNKINNIKLIFVNKRRFTYCLRRLLQASSQAHSQLHLDQLQTALTTHYKAHKKRCWQRENTKLYWLQLPYYRYQDYSCHV